MSEPITIVDYDPQWPILFEQLRIPVANVLGDLASSIEHVGSTSVPGLPAKPIIDMDVVVATAARIPHVIERLATLGYVYEGDKGIRGREAFAISPKTLRILRGCAPKLNASEVFKLVAFIVGPFG